MEQVSAETASQTTETAEAPQTQSSFSVPESYAEKGWAKDIQSVDDLWKLTDNAQSLIGKRPAGIPTNDAPQEEWDKFYQAMGRPESADKYEFNLDDVEGIPEGADFSGYEGKAKEFFHKLGLSPEKANEAWRDYVTMEMQAEQARQEEINGEFDKMSQELFGDNFDEVSSKAQAYLKANLPEELLSVVDNMDNKALMALIHVANKAEQDVSEIKKQYGAEDSLQSGKSVTGKSVAEINAELNAAKKQYRDADVFSEERKAAETKINDLRAMLSRAVR